MTAVNVSSATQATRSVHLLTHPSVHVVQPSTADSRHTEGIYDNDNKNNEQLICQSINYLYFVNIQVCKLIEDSEKTHSTKTKIPQDAITEWLLENKVLSIAFESK